MKKFLLMGALALFGMSNAQLKYGVKAGYNASNLAISTPATSVQVLLGTKSGFHAGGFVEYGLGNGFALQGEVLYNNLGGVLKVDVNKLPAMATSELDLTGLPGKEGKTSININQISVPVSAKYTFNNKFSVLGGVGINFLTGVKTKVEVDGNDVKGTLESSEGINIDSELKKQIASTNIGLHIGAEYSFAENFFLDARYNFGVSSLNKNFTDLAKLKQRYFQVGVGYKF